jgi:SAM-dependent MidA family methyltransferase
VADPALPAVLRAIRARGGPITFAEYMQIVLADRETGYYTSAGSRPTREGDFLTAPELHPIFGATVGRQLHEAWERLGSPPRFILVEYGAGSGTLAFDILAGLRRDGSGLADALAYLPIEINPHRRAELDRRASRAGLPLAGASGAPFDHAAVLANEFLDALPVHVVEMREGRLGEVHVTASDDGRPVEVTLDVSTPLLAARLAELAQDGIELREGQRAVICLAMDGWATEAAGWFERGLVLVVDYGGPAAQLLAPRRMAGTLMTYRGHAADGAADAPYRDIGDRDLTAHVETTTLRRRLADAGLAILGETTQARFLAGAGLEQLLERERGSVGTLADWLLIRASVVRLLDPRHLGAFRVLAAGRGLEGPGPGPEGSGSGGSRPLAGFRDGLS